MVYLLATRLSLTACLSVATLSWIVAAGALIYIWQYVQA